MVALIDYDGNIVKHVDTGIPVHLTKHFYYSVTMRYDEKLDRLFIDLGAGSITFEVDGDSFKVENVVNNADWWYIQLISMFFSHFRFI